jgi:hypothetical protein
MVTDVEARGEGWLRQVKLFDAIRAVIATPPAFAHTKH